MLGCNAASATLRRFRPALLPLLAAALLTPAFAVLGDWTPEAAQSFGRLAMQKPGLPAFRSEKEKVRYLVGQVGDMLQKNGVSPNTSYAGRVKSGLVNGSLTVGNCQFCAELLREALRGAGVDPRSMFLVFGNVRRATVMGLNPFEVNSTHCALAVVVNGQVVVFDLWEHGKEKGSFAGAAKSSWNGVGFAQWAVRTKHYETFGWQGDSVGSAENKAPQEAMADLLAMQRILMKPRPEAKPSAPLLTSGSYSVEAGGALLTWDLKVNGTAITGVVRGANESITGSVNGSTVSVRRSCPGWDPPYQDYTGTIKGKEVTGTFTGAGINPNPPAAWRMPLP